MRLKPRRIHFLLAVALGIASCAAAIRIFEPRIFELSELIRQVQRPSGSPSGQVKPFDLSDSSIPVEEILAGGPPKDGIPAITNPQTVRPSKAGYLSDNDRVIGVTVGSQSRAYPISILNHHEIVNDLLANVPIAVTYCPLCDSAVVFDRQTPFGVLEFGVSGLLTNSNVLMFDRSERESLWSQLLMRGISGPGKGVQLKSLPMELTNWSAWKIRHPNTDVLSDDTGFRRDYRRNPYSGYFRQESLMFPARPLSNSLPLKEPILAIWSDKGSVAIPVSYFGGKSGEVAASIGDLSFEVEFSSLEKTLRVRSADEGLSWVNSFWFAWHAFHPNTQIVGQ